MPARIQAQLQCPGHFTIGKMQRQEAVFRRVTFGIHQVVDLRLQGQRTVNVSAVPCVDPELSHLKPVFRIVSELQEKQFRNPVPGQIRQTDRMADGRTRDACHIVLVSPDTGRLFRQNCGVDIGPGPGSHGCILETEIWISQRGAQTQQQENHQNQAGKPSFQFGCSFLYVFR